MDELLISDLADYITTHDTLLLVPLMTVSNARRAVLLRRWLAGLNAPMSFRDGLERIWQEAALAREDVSSCFRLEEYGVRRYQSQLWRAKSVDGQSETITLWLEWKTPLVLPAGLGLVQSIPAGELRMPQEDEAVSIRFKASGLLHIVGRNGERELKKIRQERRIPPWRRDTTPLLFYGEMLIVATGVFVTREETVEDEESVNLVWRGKQAG